MGYTASFLFFFGWLACNSAGVFAMYICMYICMYVCMYVYIYVCICGGSRVL